MRIAQTAFVTFLTLCVQGASFLRAGEPDLKWVQERVLKMVSVSERDILHGISPEEALWFNNRQNVIHEISVPYPGNVWIWISQETSREFREKSQIHFRVSAAAFKIQHPEMGEDEVSLDVAGLESVLRAYENLTRIQPSERAKNLDLALQYRNKGELIDLVKKIRSLNFKKRP